MRCKNCGNQVPDNARVCPSCGKETTAPPKATNAKPVKVLLIVVLAAVVIGAGILVVRGIFGTGKVIGAAENGNYTGQMIRADTTTYIVNGNSDKKIAQILKIDDKADAKAQEVYRVPWPEGGYVWFSLICIKGDTLYYLESKRNGTGEQYPTLYELKSLSLKKEGSGPASIELKLKGGKQLPKSFIEAYENVSNKKFSLDHLFEFQQGFDKNHIYSILAYGKTYSRVILFTIDCTNGEVSFIEGSPLGSEERWSPRLVKDGYIYYERYGNKGSEGLFRASLSGLKEEKLLDKDTSFTSLRIMGNSLLYVRWNTSPEKVEFQMYYLDLKTKKDTLVFTLKSSSSFMSSTFEFNMTADAIYYFERGDLRSCNYDGSNDKLVIEDKYKDYAGDKTRLHILGDWFYYMQDGEWKQVKPGDNGFPYKG